MKYRREIDGLRAVAVLPVILFHAGFEWFSGGYIGVDVFFVISGYLITTIIINEMDGDGFSIAKFYERRARRILPALFFVMLCCIPFAVLWMVPSQLKDFSQAMVAISFFASNILFWRKTDYFAPAAEENPLLHTWTLAVEEQFYIFFPLLLLGLWRFGKDKVFLSIIILSAFSLILSEWGWRNQPAANFYLLPTRAWELGIGATCAFWLQKKSVSGSNLLSTAGMALILVSVFIYDKETPFPSVYALTPVIGAALTVLFCTSTTMVGKLLSSRPFVAIGLISFSAYLWHQPLFAFARIRTLEHPSQALMIILAATSIILAWLTWRFVEQPFRNKQVLLFKTRHEIFKASFTVVTIFVIAGLYGSASGGMPERFPKNQLQTSYLKSAKLSPLRRTCFAHDENIIKPENACIYHTKDGSVAVIGDSHSFELSYALAGSLKEYNLGVRQYSYSACKPSYMNGKDTGCTQWTNDSVNYISNNPNIKHVVVTYRMTTALAYDHYGSYPIVQKEKTEIEKQLVFKSLYNMLNKFLSANKNVIFVHQAPELPKNIESIIYQSQENNTNLTGVSRQWWESRTENIKNNFVFPNGVTVLNVDDIFCGKTICLAGKNGQSFYFDSNHMSIVGAQKVSGLITKSILKYELPK